MKPFDFHRFFMSSKTKHRNFKRAGKRIAYRNAPNSSLAPNLMSNDMGYVFLTVNTMKTKQPRDQRVLKTSKRLSRRSYREFKRDIVLNKWSINVALEKLKERLEGVEKNPGPPKTKGKVQKNGSPGVAPGMLATLQSLHKRLKDLEPVKIDQKDIKVDPPKLISTGKRSSSGAFAKSAKSLKVTLTVRYSGGPSAANTARASTDTLIPGASAEFASFAGMFDDYRTTHVELHYAVGCSLTATGAINAVQVPLGFTGMVYDPVDNTNLVSVLDAMDYDHRIAPVKLGYDAVNTPQAISKNGTLNLKVKIPAPVVDPGILSDLLDSNWVSTKDTGVIVGYVKRYCEAVGPSTSSSDVVFARFFVEFRSRH